MNSVSRDARSSAACRVNSYPVIPNANSRNAVRMPLNRADTGPPVTHDRRVLPQLYLVTSHCQRNRITPREVWYDQSHGPRPQATTRPLQDASDIIDCPRCGTPGCGVVRPGPSVEPPQGEHPLTVAAGRAALAGPTHDDALAGELRGRTEDRPAH